MAQKNREQREREHITTKLRIVTFRLVVQIQKPFDWKIQKKKSNCREEEQGRMKYEIEKMFFRDCTCEHSIVHVESSFLFDFFMVSGFTVHWFLLELYLVTLTKNEITFKEHRSIRFSIIHCAQQLHNIISHRIFVVL